MVERVKNGLEQEIPVYQQEVVAEDRATLANFNLTTAKPMMIVLNISEDDVPDVPTLEAEWRARLSSDQSRGSRTVRQPGGGACAVAGG